MRTVLIIMLLIGSVNIYSQDTTKTLRIRKKITAVCEFPGIMIPQCSHKTAWLLGRVKRPDGIVLKGACVMFYLDSSLQYFAVTDSIGTFEIPHVCAEEYLIKINYRGEEKTINGFRPNGNKINYFDVIFSDADIRKKKHKARK